MLTVFNGYSYILCLQQEHFQEHIGIKIAISPYFFRMTIFKRLKLITSSFSDPSILLFFVQFSISFPTAGLYRNEKNLWGEGGVKV